MHLPEDDPEAFGGLIRWLYTTKLELEYICPKEYTKYHLNFANQLISFVKAYTLADKFYLEELKNSVTDCVGGWCAGHALTPTLISSLYQNVSSSSLNKFVARKMAYSFRQAGTGKLTDMEEEIRKNPDFTMDLISAFTEGGRYSDPQNHTACTYHEHKVAEKCGGQANAYL